VPLLAWAASRRKPPRRETYPAEQEQEQEREQEHEQEQLRYVQVPFGPFLAMSALAYLLLYDAVMPWALELLIG
jgi:hypothetical protein